MISSEFLFFSWCCRWAADPQPSTPQQYRCPFIPAVTTGTSCWCSLEPQHYLMLAFFRPPSFSSQCSAEAGLSSGFGKQNCRSGMICYDFGSSSGLPRTGCTAAAPLPRYSPEQDRTWTLSSCPTVNADTKHMETVIHLFISVPWACLTTALVLAVQLG